MEMVTHFGSALISFVHIRESPEFGMVGYLLWLVLVGLPLALLRLMRLLVPGWRGC